MATTTDYSKSTSSDRKRNSTRKLKSRTKKKPVKTDETSIKVEETSIQVEETPVKIEETPVKVEETSTLEESTLSGDKSLSIDTVWSMFDSLVDSVKEEIQTLKDSKELSRSFRSERVKTLRSLIKNVKSTRSATQKLVKQKKSKRKNTQSGFLKPVQISKDMAEFAGWEPSELKSRVDVTRYLCQYVSENNLQNPKDKREIQADKNLKQLLNYDPKKEEPLTYYYMQKKIQSHFS